MLSRCARHFCAWSATALLSLPMMVLAADPDDSGPHRLPTDSPIVTDRPDVAESSRTVGDRIFQVEVGVDVSDPTRAEDRTVIFPLKIRQGIAPNVELHVETDTFALQQDGSGLTSPELGTKVHLGDRPEAWSLGLLAAVSIPLDEEQGVVFSPTLAADFNLGRGFGLGTNLGVSIFLSPRDTSADTARFATSFGKGWTDQLSTFLEGFGEVTFGGDLSLATDFGFIYQLTPHTQIDVYGRKGFYGRSDFGAGMGFSFRL